MFVAIALLALQERTGPTAGAPVSLHELVEQLPRLGECPWKVGPERWESSAERAQDALRERLQHGGQLELADWRVILLEKGYLRWRARWPVDRAFAIGLQLPDLVEGLGIELTSALAGGASVRAFTRMRTAMMCMGPASALADDWHAIGWLERGQRSVALELRVVGSTQPLGVLNLPVESVAGIDAVLQPTKAARWGAALARSMTIVDSELCARLLVGDWWQTAWLACSLDIELLHDGTIVEARQTSLPIPGHETLALHHLPRAVARGEQPARGWSVRVRGTSKNVLRDWDATQYWAGVVEVPLADLIRH